MEIYVRIRNDGKENDEQENFIPYDRFNKRLWFLR